MKQNRKLLMTAVGMFLVLAVFVTARAQNGVEVQASSVAVVDLQSLFNELKEKRELNAVMEERKVKFDTERQVKRGKIEELQFDLDELKPGTQSHELKQEEISKKLIEFQVWQSFETQKFSLDNRLQDAKIYNKALEGIQQVAAGNGFTLVLFKGQRLNLGATSQGQQATANIGIVAWATETSDITGQVVQRLNNDFNAGR